MANKNSRVINRIDRTGKVRTETSRRDDGALDIALSTNLRDGSTRLFIDTDGRNIAHAEGSVLSLDGRQARTLFVALQRHFGTVGVPSPYTC